MKFSAFIAASVDGYIATPDGGVEWLDRAAVRGPADAFMGDGGFTDYLASVDCMVMGRGRMEKLVSFNLTAEQWPYSDRPIYVLSTTLQRAPESLVGNVQVFPAGLDALVEHLRSSGYQHGYVDGGATITSFINAGLHDEICVTQVPVLLGEGLQLFGHLGQQVDFSAARAEAFGNDFVQWKYSLNYSQSTG